MSKKTGKKTSADNEVNMPNLPTSKKEDSWFVHVKDVGKNKKAVERVIADEFGESIYAAREDLELGLFGLDEEQLLSKERAEALVEKLRSYGAVTELCNYEQAENIASDKMQEAVEEMSSEIKKADLYL